MPQTIEPEVIQQESGLEDEHVSIVMSDEIAVSMKTWEFDGQDCCSAQVYLKGREGETVEELAKRCAAATVYAKREIQEALNR